MWSNDTLYWFLLPVMCPKRLLDVCWCYSVIATPLYYWLDFHIDYPTSSLSYRLLPENAGTHRNVLLHSLVHPNSPSKRLNIAKQRSQVVSLARYPRIGYQNSTHVFESRNACTKFLELSQSDAFDPLASLNSRESFWCHCIHHTHRHWTLGYANKKPYHKGVHPDNDWIGLSLIVILVEEKYLNPCPQKTHALKHVSRTI